MSLKLTKLQKIAKKDLSCFAFTADEAFLASWCLLWLFSQSEFQHRRPLLCFSPDCSPNSKRVLSPHSAKSELTIWQVDNPNPTLTLWSAIYMHTCILHILWSDLIMQSKQIWQPSLFLSLTTVCACARPVHEGMGAGQAFKWSKEEVQWQESSTAALYCEEVTEV